MGCAGGMWRSTWWARAADRCRVVYSLAAFDAKWRKETCGWPIARMGGCRMRRKDCCELCCRRQPQVGTAIAGIEVRAVESVLPVKSSQKVRWVLVFPD